MGLWSGKNLVYLECRYRRNSGEETNTQNLNYKRSVCGICLLGVGDIHRICREKWHLYVTEGICCILSLKNWCRWESTSEIKVNCFIFVRLITSSSCSGRSRCDSCSLYPQNEIGPSISSSVILCVFVPLVYIVLV